MFNRSFTRVLAGMAGLTAPTGGVAEPADAVASR